MDEQKDDDDFQIIDRIKQRSIQSPPPSMVSFFSSKSRLNQRKKRELPIAPTMYSIKIRSRPLGFFIETRKLNTIIEDQDGEQKQEQVEIVDNKNKFNKVNAYISSIASDEWQSILIIGSQLLSINDIDITGLSFSKIFQKLTSQPLPFTLKLAAPNNNNNNNDDNIYSNDNDSDNSSNNSNDDDIISYNYDIPRGRGQTIDETKLSAEIEKKRNKRKFRFKLF